MDVISEAGTFYPTWLHEFTSGFGRGCFGFFSVFLISELCLPFLLFTFYLGFVVLCWFMVLFMSWYLLTSPDEMNDPDTNTAIQR